MYATLLAASVDSSTTAAEDGGGAATAVPTEGVSEAVDAVTEVTVTLLGTLARVGGAVLTGLVIAFIIIIALRLLGHRHVVYGEVSKHIRGPLYLSAGLSGAYLALQLSDMPLAESWHAQILHLLLIAVIFAATWLLTRLLLGLERALVKSVTASGDSGRTSRIMTQAQVLRRVASAIVVILGLVSAIMTFPAAQVAMTSLLASAGLVSVIAGLAAQSTLGNVFAGLQLAMTDAIRVGDVVDADTVHGTIEEVTLTYVVVKIWDERRVILPSKYFTENPFSNWTRKSAEMQGTVMFQVDWRVPVAAMRAQLGVIVRSSAAWDGRTATLVITDTSQSTVTARVTVSAANPDKLVELQNFVREQLLLWLQTAAPYALPRTRVEVEQVELKANLEHERVARLAEELVALQGGAGKEELEDTGIVEGTEDPIEAARVRAAARGRSNLRRVRRKKIRRRGLFYGWEEGADGDAASGDGPAPQAPSSGMKAGSLDATTVLPASALPGIVGVSADDGEVLREPLAVSPADGDKESGSSDQTPARADEGEEYEKGERGSKSDRPQR